MAGWASTSAAASGSCGSSSWKARARRSSDRSSETPAPAVEQRARLSPTAGCRARSCRSRPCRRAADHTAAAMHPSEEILLAVASGQADTAHRVLVEGHLDGCASCRSTLGELSAPGGAFLFGLPAQPPPEYLWQRLQARIASSPAAP